MSTENAPRFVRLQVELVLELLDGQALRTAAREHVVADDYMDEEERAEAIAGIEDDAGEAVAYFVDPVDLVEQVPGVQLVQASWQTEPTDEPDVDEWDEDLVDDDDDDDEDDGAATDPAGA